MDEIVRQAIEDAYREEQSWKSRNPEPVMQDWPFQKELELLIFSGFVVKNEQVTERWKRDAWMEGELFYYAYYSWTPEGKEACFRNQHSTPMSWADDIHFKRARHCVVCGRDCYCKKVWAQDDSFRVVCISCGSQGHGLQDLARNEEEYQAAIAIEHEWDLMNAHARKFRYPPLKYLK